MDSQSAKTTSVGGSRGDDGGTKLSGRKRHLLVDTLGLVLRAKVPAAAMQDRAAVPQVLQGVKDLVGRLAHSWLDQGSTGAGKTWIEQELGWSVELVKHAPRPRGMGVFPGQEVDPTIFQRPKGVRHLPRRWVIETTQPQYPENTVIDRSAHSTHHWA
jgi:putative transposase